MLSALSQKLLVKSLWIVFIVVVTSGRPIGLLSVDDVLEALSDVKPDCLGPRGLVRGGTIRWSLAGYLLLMRTSDIIQG